MRGNREEPNKTVKWTARDFAAVNEDECPMGESAREWAYGDLDNGFKKAKLTLDESFVTANNPHHSMESRSTLAYWENGKCFVYGSTQSQSYIVPGLARYIGIEPEDLVYVAEFCGGGFGSQGGAYPHLSLP